LVKDRFCPKCGMRMGRLSPNFFSCKCGHREVGVRVHKDESEQIKRQVQPRTKLREQQIPTHEHVKVKSVRRKRTSTRGG
jgi:hypothetical protein